MALSFANLLQLQRRVLRIAGERGELLIRTLLYLRRQGLISTPEGGGCAVVPIWHLERLREAVALVLECLKEDVIQAPCSQVRLDARR